MPYTYTLSVRHAIHAALETRANAEGISKGTLCNELLEHALLGLKPAMEGSTKTTIDIFEPATMYSNHGRLISGINPRLHGRIKELAVDAGSSMMDLASSLLAVELGVSAEILSTQQIRPLKARSWEVQTRRSGSAPRTV